MAQDQWTLQGKKKSQKPAHGPPLQARVAAANRTVLQFATTILVHMDMDRWGQSKNERGKNVEEGSGHGMAKVAGKQSLQSRAVAGKHSRRTLRPAQALQKTTADDPAVQASQQNNSRR